MPSEGLLFIKNAKIFLSLLRQRMVGGCKGSETP